MKISWAILSILFLSSCQIPEPFHQWMNRIKKEIGLETTNTPSESKPTPSQDHDVVAFKANAEILSEMIRITFRVDEISDPDLYQSLLSSLQQGASLEGIYRGLISSSRYRGMESKSKAASANAVKFFALEMAEIQTSMKNPTHFDKDKAKQLPSIDFPEGADLPDQLDLTEQIPEPIPADKHEFAELVLQKFIGATSFTLKRVMADELLKKFDEMGASTGDIALWYASTVVRLSASKVDFGLELRNKSDFDFHHQFAKSASPDRLRWEILNRYHRIFNQLN